MPLELKGSFKAGRISNFTDAAEKARDVISRAAGGDEKLSEEPTESVQQHSLHGVTMQPPKSNQTAKDYINDALIRILAMIPSVLIHLETMQLVFRGQIAGELMEMLTSKDVLKDDKRDEWGKLLVDNVGPYIRYAIFSHRWGKMEPLYADAKKSVTEWLTNPNASYDPDPDRSAGIEKLVNFCRRAKEYKESDSDTNTIRFGWSDTCCIQKDISSELQECITSMFSWYRNSAVCIVHMAGTEDRGATVNWSDEWFNRGWTLQELLAPKVLKMYTKNWVELGKGKNDKDDDELMGRAGKATGISVNSIRNFAPGTKELGQKMKWASKRQTTRPEDIAYCLVGIFKVNMYINYGEGATTAFYRLQEQVINSTSDRTLFEWYGEPSDQNSMIANGPTCFDFKEHKDLSVFRPAVQRGLVMSAAFVCSGLYCCNMCLGRGVAVAVQLDVLRQTGEVVNKAESHFSLTNTGLQMKVDTIRVLHKYSLLKKEGHNRWYLTLLGYKRIKVYIPPEMMKDYLTDKKSKDLIVVPLGEEVTKNEAGELGYYPRTGLLLFNVGNNVWKKIRTRDPIILIRETRGLRNDEIPHTIYIK